MIWPFLIIILIAAMLLLLVMSKSPTGRPGRKGSVNKAWVNERWQAITTSAETGGLGLKNAIMEADKLLDHVMKESGFPGETMGDRLKSHRRSRFSDLDSIWRAHKLRNAFAHEVGADLVASQAKEALRDFERGLKDLGAL